MRDYSDGVKEKSTKVHVGLFYFILPIARDFLHAILR